MKHIFFIIISILLLCSCTCGHSDGEHIQNDTILCVVDKKQKMHKYNVVLHIIEPKYCVIVRNIENGNTIRINKKLFYNMFNEGDTIYEVVQHCPYYRIELKK